MSHDEVVKKHARRYGAFLQLFPRNHVERFAEPMLQTFVDMCNAHVRSGENINKLVFGIYVDTAKEIIKERSKEVAMDIKTNKSKVFIGGGVAGVVIMVVFAATIFGKESSGTIPIFSTVAEARALSKGKKATCLPNNEAASAAISKDDTVETFEYEGNQVTISNYETTAVSGFRDIPAGTDGEVTKNSYDGRMAIGSVRYGQEYGSYNYEMERLEGSKEWNLVTLSACEN